MNTNPSDNFKPQTASPAGNQQAEDLQWTIERYLLDDPTFDRDVFEQQMLADISLAEQVAASVAHLQLVSATADINRIQYPAMPSSRTAQAAQPGAAVSTWMVRLAVLASAAALLIAISAWQLRFARNEDQLARIADNWTAFENLNSEEALELVSASESDSHSTDFLRDTDPRSDAPNESTSNEQADWLVEAAREFYLASNEGAAG